VNTSIVTAIYDLDRNNWDKAPQALSAPHPGFFVRSLTGEGSYFTSFEVMLRIKNDITVFTEEKLRPLFEELQRNHSNIKVYYRDIYSIFNKELDTIKRIQSLDSYKNGQTFPGNPQIWNSGYVLVNYLKAWFINEAMKEAELNDNVAWLDFGYFKNSHGIEKGMSFDIEYDFTEKIHFIQIMDIALPLTSIRNIIRGNQVFIMGGFFVTPKSLAAKCWELMQDSFSYLANQDLMDQDQTLMFLAWQRHPEYFEVHNHSQNKFHITQYSIHKPKVD